MEFAIIIIYKQLEFEIDQAYKFFILLLREIGFMSMGLKPISNKGCYWKLFKDG